MRTDVANLLERLGKRDFHYQDFAERFTDMELWPLFETLIRDPRILDAAPHADAELAAAQPQTSQPPKAEQIPAAPAINSTDLTALFARYGGAQAEEAPSDVHALLQRLAQQLDAQQHDGGAR
jgi:hypothetical protein